MNATTDSAVWNTLHDGVIVGVHGQMPGDLVLKVEIEYLCGELQTSESYLLLRLSDCSLFEFATDGGGRVLSAHDIPAEEPIILSAEDGGDIVIVGCAGDSRVRARYRCSTVSTAEGVTVSQDELEAAATRYWTAWELRAAAHRRS